MNYADLRPFDATNGTGIGTSLFVSGCLFHCKECFNKEAWDFNYGKPFTKEVEDYFINCAKNPHVDHVSLLGGEVFYQDLDIILNLVKRIKQEVNKTLWVWSGFTFNELLKDKSKISILKYIDILFLIFTISVSIPNGKAPDPTDGSATLTSIKALSISNKFENIVSPTE